MNKRTLTIVVIAVLALIAGSVVYIHKVRNIIPSEKRMAQIMADVYVADAVLQIRGNLYSASHKNDKTAESAYHTILSNYGIDKAVYDSAMSWYSAHPAEFARVYELLLNILTKRESQFSVIIDKRDSIRKRIDFLNDSLLVSYWEGKRFIHIPFQPADSIKGKDLSFEYNLDSIHGGDIKTSMHLTFLSKNEAKEQPKLEMIVIYNDTIADTTSVNLELTQLQRDPVVNYKVRDTLFATKLKVNLMKSPEFKKICANVSNVSITYMPYQITDSVQFDEILLPPLFAY